MLSDFKKFKEKQVLCEFYLDPDDLSKFCVGYIVDYDKENCLIACLDSYGNKDGFFCFKVEDLIKIQTDTQYLICLTKILSYNNDKEYFAQKIDFKGVNKPFINRVFDYIQKEKKVASFELVENGLKDFYGFISEISDDTLVIQQISCYGCLDGFVQVDAETITNITFNSQDEQKIEILYSLESKK